MMDDNNKSAIELSISPVLKNHISNMAYWSRFIGMVGMVLCGLFLLIVLLGGTYFMTMFGKMNSSTAFGGIESAFVTLYVGFMAVMLALAGYLSFLLYDYGRKARVALEREDQVSLESGFNSIRRFFKIYGILMVVILSIYAIMLVIALVAMAAR